MKALKIVKIIGVMLIALLGFIALTSCEKEIEEPHTYIMKEGVYKVDVINSQEQSIRLEFDVHATGSEDIYDIVVTYDNRSSLFTVIAKGNNIEFRSPDNRWIFDGQFNQSRISGIIIVDYETHEFNAYWFKQCDNDCLYDLFSH